MENKTKLLCLLGAFVVLAGLASSVNVTTALASISGQYTLVYMYNASAPSPWLVYDATVPGGVGNTLTDMGVQWGYWIKVNATSATLNISGTEPSSTNISLISGWNLIGYPKLASQGVTTALSGISGQYTLLYLYNASASNPWLVYDATVPGGVGNTLANMVPGYGYWIKVNATSATLTI
ncbi:MAG: hypothetical protein ABH834_02385 [Candidatus Altiarchaeota archaeon]